MNYSVIHEVTPAMYACVIFTMVHVILVVVDMITGISLSLHYKHSISSKLWGRTVAKVTGAVLYLMLVILFLDYLFTLDWGFWIVIIPIVLACLKEYISIGENLMLRFGDKPYIFRLVDLLFKIIETVFFSWVQRLGNKLSSVDSEKSVSLRTQKHIILDSFNDNDDAKDDEDIQDADAEEVQEDDP